MTVPKMAMTITTRMIVVHSFSFLDFKIESPEQKTTIRRRENRASNFRKAAFGLRSRAVSLLRTVVGFLPSPANGVGFQPTCGFEPR